MRRVRFLIKILTGRLFYKTSVKENDKLKFSYDHSLIILLSFPDCINNFIFMALILDGEGSKQQSLPKGTNSRPAGH
jgi:hypothetical protein